MAYTSVILVRRLDRTVDYVQNKEKTAQAVKKKIDLTLSQQKEKRQRR